MIGDDLVVHQSYQTDVNLEHVIRGNSVVIRCSIPSYVADYISVESWRVDETDIFADQWGTWISSPSSSTPSHLLPPPPNLARFQVVQPSRAAHQ